MILPSKLIYGMDSMGFGNFGTFVGLSTDPAEELVTLLTSVGGSVPRVTAVTSDLLRFVAYL
jgi:hypothetical protein